MEDGPSEGGAGEDAGDGQQVRDGVDVFAEGGSCVRLGADLGCLAGLWVGFEGTGISCAGCRCNVPPQKGGLGELGLARKVGGALGEMLTVPKDGWRTSTRETEQSTSWD